MKAFQNLCYTRRRRSEFVTKSQSMVWGRGKLLLLRGGKSQNEVFAVQSGPRKSRQVSVTRPNVGIHQYNIATSTAYENYTSKELSFNRLARQSRNVVNQSTQQHVLAKKDLINLSQENT